MQSDTDPNPPCCASCRFFRAMREDELELHTGGGITDDLGRCVRYPPVFFYSKLLNAEFPVVGPGEWCGEYQVDPDLREPC